MKEKTLLFLTGMSSSGKGHFYDKYLAPTGSFHKLISATTRAPRHGEADGVDYYFRSDDYFATTPMATYLDTNANWRALTGDAPKLYGVPEEEVMRNVGRPMVYDVNEPQYVRQMQDFFRHRKLGYDFKILWFQQHENAARTIAGRDNKEARLYNTCDESDFRLAGLKWDWKIIHSADKCAYDDEFVEWLSKFQIKYSSKSRFGESCLIADVAYSMFSPRDLGMHGIFIDAIKECGMRRAGAQWLNCR
jgi:guanylate kinase